MKAIQPFAQTTLIFLLSFLTLTAVAQEDAHFNWVKSIGGSDSDSGGAIAVDSDGNVYTTGYFRNTADFDPGPGTFNLTASGLGNFISKLDANGDFVWAISLDGTGFDRGFGIAVDGDGNVYSAGYFQGTVDFDPGAGTFNMSAFNTDTYILKLDTDGNFVWGRSVGNSGGDYGRAIAVDAAQNVYVIGEFQFTVDFDPGPGVANLTQTGSNGDVFILKLDVDGNYAWAVSHGGTSDDVARSIKVDAAGNVYSTGGFYATVDFDPSPGIFNLTSAGTSDIFISKLDLDGNLVWAKSFGSTGIEMGQGLALDASGNVYATGQFYETVDFDPGAGTFNLSATQGDSYIVKLNAAGDFVWANKITGPSLDQNFTIAVDDEGSVYTGGRFYGTINFGSETDIFNQEVNGEGIIKLDTDGNFAWAVTYAGTSNELGMAITVDNNDNVYVTGQFFKADFDPSACINEITSTATDIYILKLTQGPAIPVPAITSFDPPQGPPGTTVTITGTNFDPVPSNNVVMFSGTPAQIISSNATTITTTVPPGASNGQVSITVNCVTVTSADDFITGETGSGLIIYNAVSPGGDNKNDFFRLENIETYALNKVTIYNRWGDVVFDISDYNNSDRAFKGVSNSGKDIPSGIYYYKIEFSSGQKTKTGYLSLKR